ncbi:MAG: hypothetical protein K0B00_01185 [Rhodobacteraceae bacterium]|nr:hypothetical protein [Paracoccaceae bacterium]
MKPVFAKFSIIAAVAALTMIPALPGAGFGAGPAFAKNEKSEAKGDNGADRGNRPEREERTRAQGNGDEGGNKGGNSAAGNSGNSGNRGGKSDTGAMASELKGLNAYHASAQAFANAAPNSQVGRIESYRVAVGEAQAIAALASNAAADAADADAALLLLLAERQALLDGYSGRTPEEIEAAIGELVAGSPTYDVDLAALNAELLEATGHEDALTGLADQILAAEAAALAAADAAAQAAAAQAAAEAAEAEALLAAAKGRTLSPEALAFLRAQLGVVEGEAAETGDGLPPAATY